jgi:hypothetical protein
MLPDPGSATKRSVVGHRTLNRPAAADGGAYPLTPTRARETGVLSLLAESFGGTVTRRAEATEMTPNALIPESAYAVAARGDAGSIYWA